MSWNDSQRERLTDGYFYGTKFSNLRYVNDCNMCCAVCARVVIIPTALWGGHYWRSPFVSTPAALWGGHYWRLPKLLFLFFLSFLLGSLPRSSSLAVLFMFLCKQRKSHVHDYGSQDRNQTFQYVEWYYICIASMHFSGKHLLLYIYIYTVALFQGLIFSFLLTVSILNYLVVGKAWVMRLQVQNMPVPKKFFTMLVDVNLYSHV